MNPTRMASRATPRPSLIVFDLDCTLWSGFVDTTSPPYSKHQDGKVYDSNGTQLKFYPDVPNMLKRLHTNGFLLALASRTACTTEACCLVNLYNWDQFFKYRQIYPGSKVTHFKEFQKLSGIPFKQMLFFDDEIRNIVEVKELGVTCIHAATGMSNVVLTKGFQMFEKNNI